MYKVQTDQTFTYVGKNLIDHVIVWIRASPPNFEYSVSCYLSPFSNSYAMANIRNSNPTELCEYSVIFEIRTATKSSNSANKVA